jgi:hypothetical protein
MAVAEGRVRPAGGTSSGIQGAEMPVRRAVPGWSFAKYVGYASYTRAC